MATRICAALHSQHSHTVTWTNTKIPVHQSMHAQIGNNCFNNNIFVSVFQLIFLFVSSLNPWIEWYTKRLFIKCRLEIFKEHSFPLLKLKFIFILTLLVNEFGLDTSVHNKILCVTDSQMRENIYYYLHMNRFVVCFTIFSSSLFLSWIFLCVYFCICLVLLLLCVGRCTNWIFHCFTEWNMRVSTRNQITKITKKIGHTIPLPCGDILSAMRELQRFMF